MEVLIGAARGLLPFIALALLVGCSLPIAQDLDESDANRVIVALENNGVAASKEPDSQTDGRWRVTVSREDASLAVVIMSRENLPPARAPGVLDTLNEGSIVPSHLAEHAKWVQGVAGELERSLRAIDGVLGARVHLALAETDPLSSDNGTVPPTASVLVQYRGRNSPLSVTDIQRLVAGAVPGLVPDRVSVVTRFAPVDDSPRGRDLARFGPLTLTRSSLGSARWISAVTVSLYFVLIGALLGLWSRWRRRERTFLDPRAEISARGKA